MAARTCRFRGGYPYSHSTVAANTCRFRGGVIHLIHTVLWQQGRVGLGVGIIIWVIPKIGVILHKISVPWT